ncbi:MAG TPA: CPXCG motif-containing cysteine-rich protein [Kiritimatiellia bacterium]|nr:CPXCG motif-containing cysteine-rich protein [Kiritimatiellia bacterium]
MDRLQNANVQCPYCWEQIEITVDVSQNQQEYVEDCTVCCRPMLIRVTAESGELVDVHVQMENE